MLLHSLRSFLLTLLRLGLADMLSLLPPLQRPLMWRLRWLGITS